MAAASVPETYLFQKPVDLRVGDLATRLVYKGRPGNEPIFSAVIGDIANTDLGYSEEHDFPTIDIASAAKIEAEEQVFKPHNIVRLVTAGGIKTLAKYRYNETLLLRNLVNDTSAIEEAAYSLVDNAKHAEVNYEWEISVLGIMALRAVVRSLFLAAGNDNSERHIKNIMPITAAEERAEKLSVVVDGTLQAFMFMPDQQK